jgi:virulence factor Mce-like protein
MRSRRLKSPQNLALEIFDNPVLVGTVTILVILVAVYLSYIAENGLPFVPTYNVKVQVADAAELVKNADVRIGGARVGQVLKIKPEVASKTWPHPYAQLELALNRSLEPLPQDTHYQVRLASVLGGKYLEIIPGSRNAPGLPDGGTLTLNTSPTLNHNIPFVDLDTAFATFGPKTQQGLRSFAAQGGDAVAGRGAQLNDAIYSTARLIGPLESLLRLLAAPSTNLSGFVSGLAGTTGALAPVAPIITSLLSNGATTFGALQRASLGEAIDQLPPTESVGTRVLTQAEPVLADAATIVRALKPAAALLPHTASRLDLVLRQGPSVFSLLPGVSSRLNGALGSVDRLAKTPAATQTFQVLGSNDLGSTGASAFVGLGAILNAVAPAQFACNVAGLWARNFASSLSEGNSNNAWLRAMPVIDLSQMLQSSAPAANLHANPYPIEDSGQCQSGNEVYTGPQKIGHPGRTSTTVDNTTPPAGVLDLGRKAGLVP